MSIKKVVLVGLVLSLAPAVMAQSSFGLKGVGGKLAYVKPQDIDGIIGFGAFVDLGTIAPNIALEAAVDYWSKSESQSQEGFTAEASVSDFALAVLAKYLIGAEDAQLRPFVGGGLGIHFVKGSVSVTGFGSASDTQTKVGLDVGGGVQYAVSEKVALIGELMYRIVSDVNQLVIGGKVAVKLGQ